MRDFLRIFTLLFLCIFARQGFANKNKGTGVNIPISPFALVSGGTNISAKTNFASSFWNNPAFIRKDLKGKMELNYSWQAGGQSLTSLSTIFHQKHTGYWAVGLNYSSIPSIPGYDEVGQPTTTFSANDIQFAIGKSHTMGNFSVGMNLKYSSSTIESYSSSAITVDIGGLFSHPSQDLTFALNLKNLGVQISDYSENSENDLGLDLELGMSFKPEHMPIRFSITGYGLVDSSPLYSNKDLNIEDANLAQEIFSHVLLSGNILLSKNFHVQLGYNYRTSRELKVGEGFNLSGLAYGFNFNIKSLSFAYSHAFYHNAGGLNSLSLQLDFNKILKNK